MNVATMNDAIALLPFAKACPRCGAPWAAICIVNRELDVREVLTQIATPYVKYSCGSTFHEDDHADFGVPHQEVQHADCLAAELRKHRGG